METITALKRLDSTPGKVVTALRTVRHKITTHKRAQIKRVVAYLMIRAMRKEVKTQRQKGMIKLTTVIVIQSIPNRMKLQIQMGSIITSL